MGITISKEDRVLINELYQKFNKGERVNGKLITQLYNRIFKKNLSDTSCGSCLRKRLFDVVNILDKCKEEYSKNLTESDIQWLKWTQTLPEDHYPDFSKVCELYNRVFGQNRMITNCLRCVLDMLEELYILI